MLYVLVQVCFTCELGLGYVPVPVCTICVYGVVYVPVPALSTDEVWYVPVLVLLSVYEVFSCSSASVPSLHMMI